MSAGADRPGPRAGGTVRVLAPALFVALVLCATAFAVEPSRETLDPARFDETLHVGLTSYEVREAEARGGVVPRGQVFFGQYRYVIGYYGIDALVAHLDSGHARLQFGDPLAVFVTDFSGSDPFLTDASYIDVRDDPGVTWVRAREAAFVVDSGARTPGGPAIVPFSDAADASEFADRYGGRVVEWGGLDPATDGTGPYEQFESAVDARTRWADRQVATRDALTERPVSVVVGEDAPTLRAAVERAPPNTTVVVPPGRYAVNLTLRKPLTIRGAGPSTVLDGGGSGSVVRVRADRVAITNLSIVGVGAQGAHPPGDDTESRWDARILRVYGRSDAAVVFTSANDSLVQSVSVDTPASGVVARFSDGVVVRNTTVRGTEQVDDGLMGVLALYSRLVVEDSTIRGGRDAVYTHRSDDIVVRDNRMAGMRYGVHEMYTSGALVRNNTIRNADIGVIVMTRPSGNLLVGNDVRRCEVGLSVVGDSTYVADNVLADNRHGLGMGTTRSLYTRNTVVDNDLGLRVATLLPTNYVTRNDVADNDRPVAAGSGPVAVWTVDGDGNYWGSAPGLDRDGDAVLDRAYTPSDRVAVASGRAAGGPSLARAPALALLRRIEAQIPGLRQGDVVDRRPLRDPVRPAVLNEVRNETR